MLVPTRRRGGGLPGHERAAVPTASDNVEALLGLKAELAFIHDSLSRNKRELTALIGEGAERRLARAGSELSAAIATMRDATDAILGNAEAADDSARTLAASLKDDYNRSLARDVQDQIVKIYEACNFQDIAGQHISKVIRTLASVESQLQTIVTRCSGVHAELQPVESPARGDGLLNGPKLSGDADHATQYDIDRMFA